MQEYRDQEPNPDQELKDHDDDPPISEWGDGSVIYHEGEIGQWIMYDPEEDVVDRFNHC